jgi:hypothetical protein
MDAGMKVWMSVKLWMGRGGLDYKLFEFHRS